MDSQELWDLLRAVECEDVYQFVGEQSNAPLQVLQAAAESRYASIYTSSETGDARRAGLELAGLCISDIFRDARSKQAYDEEFLGQSPPDRPSPASGSFSRPVLIGAIAVVALCLVAVVVEIAPLLSSSYERAANSELGADPESSSTVAAGDQEEPMNDFESSDQESVEVADASISASSGTNRPPRTPEGALGNDGSDESRTLARSSAATTLRSSQPKRTSRASQPSDQPERRSSSRARSPSAPERKDESIQQGAGTLTIRAAPTSVIEVDGAEVGSTGSNGFLVLSEIQPGRHVVVARKEGYAEATSIVEVQEGRAEVVELASTALPGRLTLTANVPDVLVRVGDAGEHRLPLNGLELSGRLVSGHSQPRRIHACRERSRDSTWCARDAGACLRASPYRRASSGGSGPDGERRLSSRGSGRTFSRRDASRIWSGASLARDGPVRAETIQRQHRSSQASDRSRRRGAVVHQAPSWRRRIPGRIL